MPQRVESNSYTILPLAQFAENITFQMRISGFSVPSEPERNSETVEKYVS